MIDWNHSTPLTSAATYPQAMIALRVEGADPTNPALDTFQQVAVGSVIAAAVYGVSAVQAVSIDLCINLAAHTLPAATTAFITGGFSIGGLGGGTYVADVLATSALASRCPRFCSTDATGRHFRLMPNSGTIAISQGGARGGTINDQAAIQAAQSYAEAVGATTLLLDFPQVTYWQTIRTSAVSLYGSATDGFGWVVRAPIHIQGLRTGTTVNLKGPTGASLETDWQNVGGVLWRGGGILLTGTLTYFGMTNVILNGGCAYTGSRNSPTPSTPDGADLTNKAIWLQGNELDKLFLEDCDLSGFKGEICYVAGATQTDQYYSRVKMHGSNQSAFNPSAGSIRMDNCEIGNSFGAMEILGGIGGKVANTKFYDSVQASATGGPANGFAYNSYAYPNRDLTKTPPWLDFIDCEFSNIAQIIVGNYIRILSPRVTDCSFQLITADGGFGSNGALTSTYITGIQYTIDQASQNPIMNLQGPPTLTTQISPLSGTNYIQPPNDVHINFACIHRTAHAIGLGLYVNVLQVDGWVDQNSTSLRVTEADGVELLVISTGHFALPLVTLDDPTASQTIGSGRPLAMYSLALPSSSPYAMVVSNPRHSLLYNGTAAMIATTIGAPFSAPGGYAFGQKTRIYWDVGTTAGTSFTLARNGSGLRLNADCILAVFGDWVEVEFNGITGLWHESGRSIHAA